MDVKNTHAPILGQLESIQRATRTHREVLRCGAYTFEDGGGLIDLVQSVSAKRVLELGTALGFTACCLAQGHESAHVDTIEADETHVRLAQKNIADLGLSKHITVHQGFFSDVLENLEPAYDAAFFDGFEPSIPILEQTTNLLRQGGIIICANTALASNMERRRIENYLSNPDLWMVKAPIESGRTTVCVKR